MAWYVGRRLLAALSEFLWTAGDLDGAWATIEPHIGPDAHQGFIPGPRFGKRAQVNGIPQAVIAAKFRNHCRAHRIANLHTQNC